MHRFLFILSVLSISAWSQPAQQPTQTPIVVQVQMPPTNAPNPWIHIAELVVQPPVTTCTSTGSKTERGPGNPSGREHGRSQSSVFCLRETNYSAASIDRKRTRLNSS